MSKFGKELAKNLIKRLPQSSSYEWSRRVEGALVRSEGMATHSHVVIIIDCEIGEEAAKPILGEISRFAKSNEYFRQSKYRIFLWQNDALSLLTPMQVSAIRLERHFEKITAYNVVSGNWDNFKEIYTPQKKAGQAILITTAYKVAQLETMHTVRAKNLLIVYPASDEGKKSRVVAGISCIAYNNATN